MMYAMQTHLNMRLEPSNDGGFGINLADAGHVGSHSQQVGVTALQLWCGAPSAAVVLQKQPQALQALTCALKQSGRLVCLAQQPLHQELAPLKSPLEAVDRACSSRRAVLLHGGQGSRSHSCNTRQGGTVWHVQH